MHARNVLERLSTEAIAIRVALTLPIEIGSSDELAA